MTRKTLIAALVFCLPLTTVAQSGNNSSKAKSNTSVNKSGSKKQGMTKVQKDAIIKILIGNMVMVEGGTFIMGATPEQGSDGVYGSNPAHQVTLSSFSIGKYEVTQEEWHAVMGYDPSYAKGAKLPVEFVSWLDCQEFITKLNSITGKTFRLPTEAEWEFAARGGNLSGGFKYSGGNNFDDVAWFYDNSDGKTHEVGQKQPNELGLYDMSGNVWEWCQDWYRGYINEPQTNPTGSDTGHERVFRGGGWNAKAKGLPIAYRGNGMTSQRLVHLGLRLVLEISAETTE